MPHDDGSDDNHARADAPTKPTSCRVARKAPGALEELIGLYQPRVRRLAHRLMGWNGDVDDVVQEVFLAAFEKASQYRGQASIWTWLTVITLNKCPTSMRRQAMRRRLAGLMGWVHREVAPTEGGPLGDEVTAQVRSAVARLGARDREVFVLHYLEGKSHSEIADLLGLSQNAVEVRLHRARRKLRTQLDGFMKD